MINKMHKAVNKKPPDYENVCYINYIFGIRGDNTWLRVAYAMVLLILVGYAIYLLISSKKKITEIS